MGPKLKIRQFNPATMRTNSTAMIIGKRGNGKSTILCDVLYHQRRKFNFGLYVCPTEDSNKQMKIISPPALIYSSFHDSIASRCMAYQRQSLRISSSGQAKKIFLVTDDCMYEQKTLKGKGVREVFMNGRHRDIFIINAVQYMMDIPSSLRGQIDYVFATRDNIISQREKLWKNFFGMFADYKDFSAVMDSCTEGYGCLVFDATVRTNNPEDCVFWYTANANLPPFRMCDDVFWELNSRYYTSDEADDEEVLGLETGGVLTVARV